MMRSRKAGPFFALCVLAAGLVRADSDEREVVTHPPPALNATVASSTDSNGCTTWNFRGKVSPKFRSENSTLVRLVCNQFCAFEGTCSQPPLIFPPNSIPNTIDSLNNSSTGGSPPANVDPCGNFTFDVVTGCNQLPVQLDPGFSCVFVVHTDVINGSAPRSCRSSGSQPPPPPGDPNGSAPCSGGFCPNSP